METGGSPTTGLGIDGWVCPVCLLSHSTVSPCLLQEARELVEIFFSKAASGTLSLHSGNLHIAQPRQMLCLLYLMRCCRLSDETEPECAGGVVGGKHTSCARLPSPCTSLNREL